MSWLLILNIGKEEWENQLSILLSWENLLSYWYLVILFSLLPSIDKSRPCTPLPMYWLFYGSEAPKERMQLITVPD